jgi:small-conductance mechanosensitive channel
MRLMNLSGTGAHWRAPRARSAAGLALLALATVASAQITSLPGLKGATAAGQPAAVPEPAALQASWWDFVAPEADDADDRIEALLERANESAARLAADQKPAADRSIERLRISLSALPAMLRMQPASYPPLTLAESYTPRQVLKLDREVRNLEMDLGERRSAYDVSARAVKDAWKQLDSAAMAYAGRSDAPYEERVGAGLEIMADRAEIALTEAEQRLRQKENDAIVARIAELRELGERALARISPDEERGADKLAQLIAKNRAKQDSERDALLRLRAARSSLATRPGDQNGELYLADLGITAATIEEALSRTRIALYETELDWLTISAQDLSPQTVIDLEKRLATRVGEVRETERGLADWTASVQRVIANTLRNPAEELAPDELRAREAILALAETSVTRLVRLKGLLADARFSAGVAIDLLAQRAGWRGWLRTKVLNPVVASVTAADAGLATSLFRIGDTPVTTYGLLRVVLVLGIALLASRVIRHLLSRYGARRVGASSAGLYTVSRLLHYVLIAVGLMVGLSSIGLDFSQFALFAGALSIGIGFGLQSIVSNFMSGLIILFEQSLKVGDVVELDSGVRGVVREIRVRSTLISTNDGVDIVVPNAEFIAGKVINFTLREPYHRIHVPFGVAYQSDKERVRNVVMEAANAIPFTHQDASRHTDVWLVRFGDNSLDFELVVWINPSAVTRPGAVLATYLWEIETALARAGIQIPFPQRDVRVTVSADDAERLAAATHRNTG